MRKIITITCAVCSKTVSGRFKPSQRFCSRECASKGKIKHAENPKRRRGEFKKCAVCKKEFYTTPGKLNSAKNAGKYCSIECRVIGTRTGYHPCPTCGKEVDSQSVYCSMECSLIGRPQKRKNGKTVNCEHCNKEFYLCKVRLGMSGHYFCCKEHYDIWSGRNKTRHVCKICGKEFKWSPSRTKDGNPIYCSIPCRNKDPEFIERLRTMNIKQQELKPNKLEQLGYSLLDTLGVTVERQKMIAHKFAVDAFLTDYNTIIQFDGDYWHGNPSKYQVLDSRQQKRVNIDRSQNAYFAKCGYTVLRFWECDIHKRPEWVIAQIQAVIQSNPPLPTQP